jgi:hypothetical protein
MGFFEDLKKPINILFLLLGIVGIVLTVLYYYNSKTKRDVSYYVVDPPSLIYDSKSSSSAIRVLARDSSVVNDNVYVLTGVIWNSGNLSITKGDLRQDLSLNLSGAKKILDFKIIRSTDPIISQFALKRNSVTGLGISWKYFDPNYAFRFQIIYTGKADCNFNIQGKILGVTNFNKITDESKGFPLWGEVAFCAMMYVIVRTVVQLDTLIFKNKRENLWRLLFWAIPMTIVIILLFTVISKYIHPTIPI